MDQDADRDAQERHDELIVAIERVALALETIAKLLAGIGAQAPASIKPRRPGGAL